MKRISFLILLLLVLLQSIFSQQARQYSYRHFSEDNGLVSNTVSTVIQDDEGYIWFGTINGLQRYDGNSYITFKSQINNPSSIPSNHVVSTFLDKNKNLWLITINNRIGIFDTKKFVFREAIAPVEIRKFFIRQHLMETTAGDLILIKHDGGIFKYDPKRNEFVYSPALFPLPDKWKANQITWDERIGRYWISSDSGIVQFNPATRKMNYRGHNPDGDPVIESFSKEIYAKSITVNKAGDVIFHYWGKTQSFPTICRYSRKNNTAEKFTMIDRMGYHEVYDFLVQRNGRVWVYGLPYIAEWSDGAERFDFIFKPNGENKINFDAPFHMYEDKESNIWIGTDNGVFLLNPDAQIFNTYSLVRPGGIVTNSVPVQAAAELDDGRIFIGCWGAGLFVFDQKFNPLPLPPSIRERAKNLSVWDMAVHPITRHLWITLQAGGLVVYDPRKNSMTEFYPEVFGGSTIRQVDEDTSGNLWFGTQNGRVIKWDMKKAGNDIRKGYEMVCQIGKVDKIHYDYQGFIWAGSMGNGLVKIDVRNNKIVKVFSSDGPAGERIFMDSPSDMTYHNDSTLIVSAGCLNIINTKTNKVTYISTEHGLPANTAQSVEKDEKGILWVGMTNGICRINLQKNVVSFYDRRDGIAYDKFATAGVKELNDGRIILFTDHNFLVFDPEKFGQQNLPPRPLITSFTLAGKILSIDSLSKKGNVVLNYDNTSIGIHFSSLSYLQQRKVHYYYMLEGADKDWVKTDYPKEAIYNYLGPGTYVFKVRSENPDGISNNYITSMTIVVRAPFWKTWWFYGIVILLVFMVLYLIDRERINKRRSMQQMRREIASNLHTEVNETLNNINVLTEIAKIKADKNIEQSKAFIDQISTKSKNMIEAMDDMLWSIDPKNDNMQKTLLRFKEYTENVRSAYGVNIDLIVDNKVQTLELDMKLRHEILSFYKEVLNFLLVNNRCTQVFVNINLVRSKLLLEILTECKGVSDEFKTRFQKIIRKRENTLPATIDVIADSQSFSVVLFINLKK